MRGIAKGIAALAMLIAGGIQAHEFWIIPHDAQSRTDAQVLFELRIGSGLPGKPSPRISGLVADFTATDENGVYAVRGHDNSLVVGHLRPRVSGATIAAMRTHEAQITLPANEFEDYLREEGLEKVIRQRQQTGDTTQSGSELYSRCAKTIILVDGKSNGFDKTVGLPLELVPLTEPLGWRPGQDYHLRLLRDGKPLAGTLVKAQIQGKKRYLLKTVTNAQGEVSIALPEPGVWLFSAVDMEPSSSLEVEWQSLWASVTLAVGEKGS